MSECANCNAVYKERDMLVALVYALSRKLGYEHGMGRHIGENWDDDWRHIVFLDLPTGQMSWHIHDSEIDMFAEGDKIKAYTKVWDGHSTEEKYRRVLAVLKEL